MRREAPPPRSGKKAQPKWGSTRRRAAQQRADERLERSARRWGDDA